MSNIEAKDSAPLSRLEQRVAALREADTDSVKTIAGDAYAAAARIRAMMAPVEEDFIAATTILQERMMAAGASFLDDERFEIALVKTTGQATKDDDRLLRELTAAKQIDGNPIPPEAIAEAISVVTPEPEIKSNLTKLKTLAKKYGKPVQDIIDRCVTPGAPKHTFTFKPKESKPT